MRLLPEPLPALWTPVWPTVRMDPLVLKQRRLLLKIFPARQTLEQTQIAVGPLAGLAALLHDVRQPSRHVRCPGTCVLVGVQTGSAVTLTEGRQHHARLLEIV